MAKKDIFDLFREQSEGLKQSPSPQLWGRIERRIPGQRPRVNRAQVRRIPRPLSIAAGLALLLGLSVVFLWLSEQRPNTAIAQQQVPLELEELEIIVDDSATSVVDKVPTHAVAVSKKPIVEGNAQQRLVAKREVQDQESPNPMVPSDSTQQERERRTGR